MNTRQFAIVTGASSGIGYELAKLCAQHNYDLLVAADDPGIHDAAEAFRGLGATVDVVEADLATLEGVDLMDTKVGVESKDDPAVVAKDGFDAMLAGKADVVSGWKNKLQTTIANVTPNEMLAEQHRKMAEPGSAKNASK